MGIHCNMIKLRILELTPLIVPKWRKDETSLYTPSPTIHKTDLQIEKYYLLKMIEKRHEAIFLQLCDNVQTLD